MNQSPLVFPRSYTFKLPKELSAAVNADLAASNADQSDQESMTLQDLGRLDLGGLSDDTQAGIDDLVDELVMKPFRRSQVLADERPPYEAPCELCKEIEQVKTLEEYKNLRKARDVWATLRLRLPPSIGPDEYMCRYCGADVFVFLRDDDAVEVTVQVQGFVE